MKMLSHLNRYTLLILCQHCITTGFLICTLTRKQEWQGRTPLHVRYSVSISSSKDCDFYFPSIHLVANTYLNMDLLNARSRKYSAAICAHISFSELSLYWSLHRFFSHPWHYYMLFSRVQDERIKLNPDTVLHLLASSTWTTNLNARPQHQANQS
jgi:hypothetical protein